MARTPPPTIGAAVMLLADLDSGPLFEVLGAYRAGARICQPVPPSNEVRERALGMLAQSEPALELIDRAEWKDACHYALNLEQIELPCFSLFRRATALLSLRTLEFGFTGEADRAAASLISSLRMLRVFETEPELITHFATTLQWRQPGA